MDINFLSFQDYILKYKYISIHTAFFQIILKHIHRYPYMYILNTIILFRFSFQCDIEE